MKLSIGGCELSIHKDSIISTYLLLLNYSKNIGERKRQSELAERLGIKASNLNRTVKKLTAKGFLKQNVRSSYADYELTALGKEALKTLAPYQREARNYQITSPQKSSELRNNNVRLAFPILKDNPKADWQEQKKFGTWWGQIDVLIHPIRMTIVKGANLNIFFHEFKVNKETFEEEFRAHTTKGLDVLKLYMQEKGIEIDWQKGETVAQEIADQVQEYASKLETKNKITVNFGRNAESILPTKMEAKAWIDHSKSDEKGIRVPEVEWNDFDYGRKVIAMPETVAKMDVKQDRLQEQLDKLEASMHKFVEKQAEIFDKLTLTKAPTDTKAPKQPELPKDDSNYIG